MLSVVVLNWTDIVNRTQVDGVEDRKVELPGYRRTNSINFLPAYFESVERKIHLRLS